MTRVKRGLWPALDLLPLLLALVLVGGLVYSLISLIFVGHPDIGWSEHVMADAKAIARGHFPYGDPGSGYVGMLYTPLFPSVVAILLRITWWEGWGPFVSMVAVGVTLFALGRFAWGAGGDRLASLARAAVVVALPLSAFTIFTTNGVFEGRTDQLAWCFFVVGALRVLSDVIHDSDRGVRGRLVTGVLLALSVLTKQTTLAACVAVAVVGAVVGWRAVSGSDARTSRAGRIPFEGFALVALLGVALAALQAASDGFAFDLLFGVPRRQARVASVRDTLQLDLKLVAVPILILLVAVIVSVIGTRRRAHDASGAAAVHWARSPAVMAVAAAVIIAVATVPGTVLAQTKQGGDFNALAGPVWAMALIVAATLVTAPPEWSRHAVRASGALLVVCSVLPFASTHDKLRRFDGRAFGAPSLELTHDWETIPPDLVAAAEHNTTVFDWVFPSYSVAANGPSYPGGGGPNDLTAAGYTPRWIVRDLLEGRWDRVRLYPEFLNIYMSAYGKYDTGFAWKINYLITHGYTRVENQRDGEDFYAPGPRLVDVQELASCFGPYKAGPLQIRVREGGGLWCIRGKTLRLDDGPSATSELVLESSEPVAFDLHVDDPGAVHLECVPKLPAAPVVIRLRLHPGRRGACDGALLKAGGADVLEVEIGSDSVSLVVDVDAHVSLRGFRSGGKDVQVHLHNPKPSEL